MRGCTMQDVGLRCNTQDARCSVAVKGGSVDIPLFKKRNVKMCDETRKRYMKKECAEEEAA